MTNLIFSAITVIAVFFTSCQKEFDTTTISNPDSSIANEKELLAVALVEVFTENPSMLNYTLDKCYEYFDGDRNVLISSLCKSENSSLKSSSILFSELLNKKHCCPVNRNYCQFSYTSH